MAEAESIVLRKKTRGMPFTGKPAVMARARELLISTKGYISNREITQVLDTEFNDHLSVKTLYDLGLALGIVRRGVGERRAYVLELLRASNGLMTSREIAVKTREKFGKAVSPTTVRNWRGKAALAPPQSQREVCIREFLRKHQGHVTYRKVADYTKSKFGVTPGSAFVAKMRVELGYSKSFLANRYAAHRYAKELLTNSSGYIANGEIEREVRASFGKGISSITLEKFRKELGYRPAFEMLQLLRRQKARKSYRYKPKKTKKAKSNGNV